MLSTAAKNLLLDHFAANAGFAGLHVGIPDDLGSGEVAGGSYARLAITWTAASGGILTKTAPNYRFTTPPSSNLLTFIGLWSASSGGIYRGRVPIGPSIRGVATALGSSDTLVSYAHGLVAGARVILTSAGGVGNYPSGLSQSTLYFAVGATPDTFQVSLTSGGAAVDMGDGECSFLSLTPRLYPISGYFTADTLAVDFNFLGG